MKGLGPGGGCIVGSQCVLTTCIAASDHLTGKDDHRTGQPKWLSPMTSSNSDTGKVTGHPEMKLLGCRHVMNKLRELLCIAEVI